MQGALAASEEQTHLGTANSGWRVPPLERGPCSNAVKLGGAYAFLQIAQLRCQVDAARRTQRLRELRAEVEAADTAWMEDTLPVGREAWYPADRGLCEAGREIAELAEALCPVPPEFFDPGWDVFTADGSSGPRLAAVPTTDDWALVCAGTKACALPAPAARHV